MREAAEKAQQQQELLQDHAARLEKQREDLEDVAAGQRKANEGLNARLATLDETRQTLQESADGLRVQQVRQDHETQNLQQMLKRRSMLGLLMFLLVGGALVYLLTRGPVAPEGLQSLMQAGSTADEEAKAAIADLEKDMKSMRLELSAMVDSLAQVARSVDEITATAAVPGTGARAVTVGGVVSGVAVVAEAGADGAVAINPAPLSRARTW